MIDKLKSKWNVSSTKQVFMILLVFSLTGPAILVVKQPIYGWLHINETTSLWIKIPVVILCYQVLLLCIGAALGQGRFFWEKEKRILRLFSRSEKRGALRAHYKTPSATMSNNNIGR